MTKNRFNNKLLLIIFFMSIWVLMLVKTVMVSAHEPESFFSPFYSAMFDNTWQSHFNFDLLLFSAVLGIWAIYRESLLFIGILIAMFSVLFGGVFTFLYLLICAMRSKGDLQLFFNGKTTSLN